MELQTAKWWEELSGNSVRCLLCPKQCVIADSKSGFCGVRINSSGTLKSLAYARPVALQVDPIEKKPLREFIPGTTTFSLGTHGCNLDCAFCQNSNLSRGKYSGRSSSHFFPAEEIIELALRENCKSVAFTYNEPTVFAEYAIDIAKLAKEAGLATVLVSNAYISMLAARDLYPLIDAANLDMKGFSEDFYRDLTAASLKPVLEAIKYFHSLGKHLELTNLVIPGKNDSDSIVNSYLDWLENELDCEVPLHFSAYHPAHRYRQSPRTPPETLYNIRDKAEKRGFTHVYLGNIL